MRAPAFWWRRRGLAALLALPFSLIYGAIAGARMRRAPRGRPPLPLVCVGNFVAGGAGKTPTAIALAEIARSVGLEPVFLTRGHGGRLGGPVLVDPGRHDAGEVGDEALLLARIAPTVVARRRASAFALLAGTGADLCIMDDGFQNASVEKSFSFVVVDGTVGIGNGLMMPAGPLRAPLALQMSAADAIVVVGGGAAGRRFTTQAARGGKTMLRARFEVVGTPPPRDRPLYAFAGIGRPEKFFDQLRAEGYALAGTRAFADHHVFTDTEAREILQQAERRGSLPVTTQKDAARLAGAGGASAALAAQAATLAIACRFEAPALVAEKLREIREDWLRRTYG